MPASAARQLTRPRQSAARQTNTNAETYDSSSYGADWSLITRRSACLGEIRGARDSRAQKAPGGDALQGRSTLKLAEALAKGLVGLGDDDDGVRVDLGDDVLERGDV